MMKKQGDQARMQPLVSVIVPTYNRAWTLKRALDSVLDQDYPGIELIVVDDGSTDETRELLETYQGRMTCIFQANRGVSAARNRGIRQCSGALVALLDSDDAWEQGKISCQVDFFNRCPEAMICQTEEIWIRNGRRVNPARKHRKRSGDIFEASLNLCLVSPSAVMMRKSLFEQKGFFNETFQVCEDYDLWLRVSATLPVFLIDQPLTVKYGGHHDQLSSFHSQDRYRIRSIRNLLETGNLLPDQQAAAVKVLQKKCRIYANGCFKRGKRQEGEKYLKISEMFTGLSSSSRTR